MEPENNLQIISKAYALAVHTIKVTSNSNHFPKKYRFSLVDKMQKKCLEIYEILVEANRINLDSNKSQRIELQTKAITCCDLLLFYLKLSLDLELISSQSVDYWSKMVTDVKYMALAWRKKDKSR